MNQLAKFVRLSLQDKLLLLRAWWLLATATARLRILSHQQNRLWIEGQEQNGPHPSDAAAQQVAWAIALASRYVPFCLCLPQAIAGRELLGRMGYRSTVRIGVRKSKVSVQAHAWLESNGRIWVGDSIGEGSPDQASWAVLR